VELIQIYTLDTLYISCIQKVIFYSDHTILNNSDIKTHFRLNIKKCALCNKVLQTNFNYIIYTSNYGRLWKWGCVINIMTDVVYCKCLLPFWTPLSDGPTLFFILSGPAFANLAFLGGFSQDG